MGGLEELEWGRIEAVDRLVLRPGQLYVVRSRSGSWLAQMGDTLMDTRNSSESDYRTGQHLILPDRTLQEEQGNEVRDKGAGGEALSLTLETPRRSPAFHCVYIHDSSNAGARAV